MPLAVIPHPGQLVTVRQRPFVVLDVQRSGIGGDVKEPVAEAPEHLVFLSSVEDDALGEELQVVWELEPGAHAFEKMALPEPTGFDAFLDAVRWGGDLAGGHEGAASAVPQRDRH